MIKIERETRITIVRRVFIPSMAANVFWVVWKEKIIRRKTYKTQKKTNKPSQRERERRRRGEKISLILIHVLADYILLQNTHFFKKNRENKMEWSKERKTLEWWRCARWERISNLCTIFYAPLFCNVWKFITVEKGLKEEEEEGGDDDDDEEGGGGRKTEKSNRNDGKHFMVAKEFDSMFDFYTIHCTSTHTHTHTHIHMKISSTCWRVLYTVHTVSNDWPKIEQQEKIIHHRTQSLVLI